MTKYCKHCQVEHPLTEGFWYRLNGSPRCKSYTRANASKRYDPARTAEYNKLYREVNGDHLRQQAAKWREDNVSRYKANASNYYYSNKSEILSKAAVRHKARLKVDPAYKLGCYLRSRLYSALRRGGSKSCSAVKDLGCTLPELRIHLESRFQEGMTWDNHGTHGWHIDHVTPLASFDLQDREQFLVACHYSNLQPLWAVDNLSKSCKVL